jgi:hypothetical protein
MASKKSYEWMTLLAKKSYRNTVKAGDPDPWGIARKAMCQRNEISDGEGRSCVALYTCTVFIDSSIEDLGNVTSATLESVILLLVA